MIRILETAKDYPSHALNKIALSSFVVSTACFVLLTNRIDALENWVRQIPLNVEFQGLQLPLPAFMVGLIVAILFRMVKFHDKVVSDLLRIRYRFDTREILLPLAACACHTLSVEKLGTLFANPKRYMYRWFYAFASGTEGKEKIDRHFIIMALDQWAWYWVVVEASVVVGITSLVLFFAGDGGMAYPLLFVVLLAIGWLLVLRGQAIQYAHQQVEKILELPEAAETIRRDCNAL